MNRVCSWGLVRLQPSAWEYAVTGASCVLAESIGSTAAALTLDGAKKYPVGIEINANHISSPTDGHVYAKAVPVHVGGSTSVWNIDITDDQEKRVCFVRFTALHKSYRK